jgi:hypothetical protein
MDYTLYRAVWPDAPQQRSWWSPAGPALTQGALQALYGSLTTVFLDPIGDLFFDGIVNSTLERFTPGIGWEEAT